ncbi:group II intron reverse transcriptase/maturase [Alicyclobacillus fastidiosus]|uniref:Group II intron reverse transcriptase/maturase n=1 Tax=Alicyclobacillus fastidiosus TaxID=392011 RepID=A0ABY6ZIP1_9BACL|nr:group II intron reverse transcriptase/maturase [Alicyclobacillus fastidiosus]WAH42453.1 group II intron reverse transcriptase/maturase [Alicyclobacillus fastidiosus]GMA64286.1 group II intron reverse transcriptase/maturase [Alicyclobacillus fastidiosus]
MKADGTGRKIHSLIDKVYHRANLELAWKLVKQNGGSGGIDNVRIADFERVAAEELARLHQQLKQDVYRPIPVRRVNIPKRNKPTETRPLGIPAIRDRVCQQALKNRLEPIFELTFSDCSFGYRPGRSTHQAMRKIYREIMNGCEWVVDADLRDFFGNVQHERLIDMISERISDGRILRLIRQMLEAGYMENGVKFQTVSGTPQGGIVSPLFSNIYLTPFDRAMENKGYRLTRFADDWVVLCKSREEAVKVFADAKVALEALGLTLHPEKTRITHISAGFEFLGYKLKRGKGLTLSQHKVKKGPNRLNIYAIPTEKSVKRFQDTIRQRTKRRLPLTVQELIDRINPVIRGWGNYYRKAHVRKLFNRLQRWIIQRIRSHQYKRWRNGGWRKYPERRLYGEFRLVNLMSLIPDLNLMPASTR